MNIIKTTYLHTSLFCLLIFSALNSGVNAQSSLRLDKPLPVDSGLVHGELNNGVNYYIRKNQKPEDRLEMRLIIKAGSVQETEQQRGLAHFVEHMCFNGTKHFKEQELVDFLEKMGIKFGPDLNAFTSLDVTTYKLQIPVNKPGLTDTAFMVLEDWAHNVSLKKEEIDKERGVIEEEWRQGLGARDRLFRKIFPVIFKDSKYAKRLPIGKMDIVKNCDYQTLIDFYETWYRPDLMGVLVVGDTSETYAQKKIQKHFSKLQMPEDPKERKNYEIPNIDSNIAKVFTDPEALYNQFRVYFKKYEAPEINTIRDYKNHVLIPQLCNALIKMRLNELKEDAETPFVHTGTGHGHLFNLPVNAFRISAVAKENRIQEAIDTLFYEVQRIKAHGFTAAEVNREKEKLLTNYKERAKEAGKTSSGYFINKYTNHFLHGHPIPGLKKEHLYARALMPEITINELNELARKWMPNKPITTIVTAPKKNKKYLPSESQILNEIASSNNENPPPYKDRATNQPLLDTNTKLKKSPVTEIKENQTFSYKEITLQNGIQVILKPTTFKNDQILFSAISPGGHSLYPDSNYMSAKYLDKYINQSGIGAFNKLQLQKKLAGNTASINFRWDDISEKFQGNVSPEDTETLFKLIYLYFKHPRKDSNALNRLLSKEQSKYKFSDQNPRTVFYDTLQKLITQNHPRTVPYPSDKQLKEVSLDKIYRMYKERVANAADYRFFFIGNFTVDSIIPKIEKYLGTLPTSPQSEQWKNVNPDFPEGVTKRTIHKGMEPQSFVAMVLNQKFDWAYDKKLKMNMVKTILSIRLRKKLREQESEVYGVHVRAAASRYPDAEYMFQFMFGCHPSMSDSLTEQIRNEIKALRNSPPTSEEMNKVHNIFINKREKKIRKNGFWKNQLVNHYFLDYPLQKFSAYKKKIKDIGPKDIQEAAQTFLNLQQYVQLTLKPESYKAKEHTDKNRENKSHSDQ